MWGTELFGFTLYQLFWYFFVYSTLGWCMEVVFHTVNTGKWVNRGFLNGPICPIYGSGVLIVLCVLSPFKDHLLVLFVGGAVLTSLLELATGFVLEKSFHTHWWDYSEMPYNLGGYICLKFSLFWGVGCVLVVGVLHPFISSLVALMPRFAGELLAWPVLVAFFADTIVTATAIAHMNRDLGEMEKITAALHRQADLLSQAIGETSLAISDKLEDAKSDLSGKLEGAKSDLSGRLSDKKAEAARKLDELQSKYDALTQKKRIARRLARAFPKMRHTGVHGEAFNALRDKLSKK
ncbi:MAG: hypothetical protein RSF90_00670 [Pygmaiobacter sp.]